MPAKPISFGKLEFKKKGDAIAFLQGILHAYDVGDKVSAEHARVLHDAITHHPDANDKIGCGISHFSVRSADFGTKCFWVNRKDGTTEKFSYRSCCG